jgi:hypothetical protein
MKFLRSIWFGVDGEGGEGIYLSILCLVQFSRGKGREEEGSQIPPKATFCSPQIGGIWRGGKIFIFLLHSLNYPQFYIKIPKLSLLKFSTKYFDVSCLFTGMLR